MSEPIGGVPAKQAAQEAGSGAARRPPARLALELVAMRGKDVVGVRHLHEGGTAWIGNQAESMARVSMRDFGDAPLAVGEVRSGTYTVQVPPRARARVHGSDGVPRLLVGPHRIPLREGERAVVVLGAVQIRAQVVPFEVPATRFKVSTGAAWLAVLGAIYAVAIALTAALSQPSAPPAQPGLGRAHQRFLPQGR